MIMCYFLSIKWLQVHDCHTMWWEAIYILQNLKIKSDQNFFRPLVVITPFFLYVLLM